MARAWREVTAQDEMGGGRKTDFFAVDLAPLLHSASSAAAFFADSAAAFRFADSAFYVSC